MSIQKQHNNYLKWKIKDQNKFKLINKKKIKIIKIKDSYLESLDGDFVQPLIDHSLIFNKITFVIINK